MRAYREQKLAGTGITPLFPLWQRPTDALAREMIAAGVETYLVCVDLKQLPKSFAGRRFDDALLAELPASADPCGEKGEFHSCVVAGPMFSRRIDVTVGETIERDGFAYTDLTPEGGGVAHRADAGGALIGEPRPDAARCAAPTLQAPRKRGTDQPRSTPPVRFDTSATIFLPVASISSSVIVFSRGCKVTAIAIDFLPGSMPLPS